MLNPWAYTRKNHTTYLRSLVGEEKSKHKDEVTLNDIIDYLKSIDGNHFGEKTFAPVYESGKSIKEIDLLWAPVIESMFTHSRFLCLQFFLLFFQML